MNDMNNTNKGETEPVSTFPADDEIRRILVERIDVRRQSVGMVVGVIDSNEQRVISYGHPDVGDPRPVSGDSVFEIGSITKVFTKLLLADMAQRGEVSLDDPVAMYLSSTVRLPERNGRAITLFDLATHSSGLPREPENMSPSYTGNPYAEYTIEQLYQFLSNYSLTRDIGSQLEYSNLGVGLLGHALARRADTDYESLVYSRICAPLGMNDTRITFTPDMKARLAAGHDPGLTFIENWDMGVFAGAGGLRSTVNDLLIFLSANIGFTKSPLDQAMAAAHSKVCRPTGQPDIETRLDWGSITSNGKEIFLHNGGTGGYCSSIGFNADARAGAVVLSNTGWLVDDIMLHLLDASFPLAKPPSEHAEVKINSSLYDFYVGHYQMGSGLAISISRDGDRLFAQATGMAKYEIFPESERDFFYKVMDGQITFVAGDEGYVTELTFDADRGTAHLNRVE